MNGEVFEVVKKKENCVSYNSLVEKYAVKSVNKTMVREDLLQGLRDEITILKQVIIYILYNYYNFKTNLPY